MKKMQEEFTGQEEILQKEETTTSPEAAVNTAEDSSEPQVDHIHETFYVEDTAEGWESVVNSLKEELEKTRKEAKGNEEQYLRLQAEFSNFRKRKEKEFSDYVKYANEDLVKQLLPVLDNFERTIDAIDKSDNLTAIKEGINLVNQAFRKQLEKIGLRLIDTKDQRFDVSIHEAITAVTVEEEEKKGSVIDVVEQGYKLNDKVIRFAKVIVGE